MSDDQSDMRQVIEKMNQGSIAGTVQEFYLKTETNKKEEPPTTKLQQNQS